MSQGSFALLDVVINCFTGHCILRYKFGLEYEGEFKGVDVFNKPALLKSSEISPVSGAAGAGAGAAKAKGNSNRASEQNKQNESIILQHWMSSTLAKFLG